ncbi:MAG: hypothetical protein QM607_12385 [Microbacterium sp.]
MEILAQTALANTGGDLVPWIIGLAVVLAVVGGGLLIARALLSKKG